MIMNPANLKLLRLGLPTTPCNGSSGGGGNTTSTNTTTNIPEYAKPYFMDLMNQTQAVSGQGYVPYDGARIQGQTPAQMEAANRIGSASEPSQIAGATNMTGMAAQGMQGMTDYSTPYIGSTFNPQATQMYNMPDQSQMYNAPQQSQMYNAPQQSQMFNAPSSVQSQYQPGQFTGSAVSQYMNPYEQNVVDTAKRESNNQFQQQNIARDSLSAAQGAFGGDRAALVKQEAQRGQNLNLNAIQNQGDQAAYNAATQQFNANQGQQQVANQQGLGANTFNSQQQMAYGQAGNQNQQFNTNAQQQYGQAGNQNQQFNANLQQQYGQAGNQNQQFNANLQQQYGQAGNQNQQFNANQQYQAGQLGLQGQMGNASAQAQAAGIQQAGWQGLGAMGNQMGNLGQTQQNLYLQRASALNQVGTQQQQTGQQALDAAYQNFVNQRDYPKSQLNFYSGILHGVPVSANSDVQTTTPAPSTLGQLAGLGIAGAGAYNAYSSAQAPATGG